MDQWAVLERTIEALADDYSLRRQMLLTRLDATIQSFSWSSKMVGREGEIGEMYRERRDNLIPTSTVGIPELLAARQGSKLNT